MKLVTKQDVEVPRSGVFAALTDFDFWERAAMRRGADVHRTDTLPSAGVGMAWRVKFDMKGRQRSVAIKFTEVDPGNRLRFNGDSPSVQGTLEVELLELSARRTRMTVKGEIFPKTLAARIFIQSMKIAKGKVQRRFDTRVAQIATDLEERYRRARA